MVDFKKRLEQYKEQQNMAAKKPEDMRPGTPAVATTITDVLATLGPAMVREPDVKEIAQALAEDRITSVTIENERPTLDLTDKVSEAMKSIPSGAFFASEGPPSNSERVQPLSAGRVVSYDAGHPDGPYVAICVQAHNATCGNLVYWTHDGHQSFIERSVFGKGRRCWQWPKRV